MSKASRLAICTLLGCASTCVALPLYEEVIPMPSGPPHVTYWAGWPVGPFVREAPLFWLLPALAMSASALVLMGRRRPAGYVLGALLGLFVFLGISATSLFRSEMSMGLKVSMFRSGPGPAFYPAAVAVLLALLLIATARGSSAPSRGRP